MLNAALFEATADADKAVMIGDTVFDIEMACRAGVRGIGVDWGYHPPSELMAAGAEFVAGDPAELQEYLLK
jgi:phosphoglycolate phosphatase